MNNLIAQLNIGDGKYNIQGSSQLPKGGLDSIFVIIGNATTLLLVVIAVASLFMIIFSGIQWTTSGGDEKNIEKAKGRLKYSIIGLIVALSAFAIIQFIGRFFGIASPLLISL